MGKVPSAPRAPRPGARPPAARDVLDARILALRDALRAHPTEPADPGPNVPRAAVALLVRPAPTDLELLLIRRAVRQGDPWSGHMALPGGRADPGDADAVATAVRETHEEVGIDLRSAGVFLGGLDVLAPRSGAPRIAVWPFVFGVKHSVEAEPNHEVESAVWIPVGELTAPGAVTEHLHEMEGRPPLPFPAYGPRGYVIWGLTYRMLEQFLQRYEAARAGETPP